MVISIMGTSQTSRVALKMTSAKSLSIILALFGVIVIGQSESAVNLAWTASPDERTQGYILQWFDKSSGLTSQVDVGNVVQASVEIGTPSRYCFTVIAYGQGLVSDPSNEVCGLFGPPMLIQDAVLSGVQL